MLRLDYKKGGGKETLQNTVLCQPPSWEEDKEQTESEARGPQNTNFTLFGGLENRQEVVPPFWAQKCDFRKFAKPFFNRFQENPVVAFLWKRLCCKKG